MSENKPITPNSADDYQEQMHHALNIQQRYGERLMRLPHVVGVAVGYATIQGELTQQIALIVMVDEKVSPQRLPANQRIPNTIEGVRIDVQEMGTFLADSQFTANEPLN